jgi:KaiC/GvpD/RAD55 family RecA-like ATPase
VTAVRIVAVPATFPPKWDLADPIPQGADLVALLREAPTARQPGSRLRRFIRTAAVFSRENIPPREFIIEPFLPTSSLSMVYAARGIGKTWFALSLCVAISHGHDFLRFPVERARRVLFIDGEMALADLQERIRALDLEPSDHLYLLPSENLFREDRPLNINAKDDQEAIEKAIEEMTAEGCRPEVVVFDNLSSLSGGIDENDNSALDALLRWLVSIRHKGLAVVLVHHAGKSGDQRGASRREDLLDTSIKLSRPKPEKGSDEDDDLFTPPDGAYFELEFVKTRGRMPSPSQFMLELVDNPQGFLEWYASHGDTASAADKTLKAIALRKPGTQNHLAELRNLSKGAVSQHCKQLRNKGYLEGGLSLTFDGRKRLVRIWPDLDAQLPEQEDLPI